MLRMVTRCLLHCNILFVNKILSAHLSTSSVRGTVGEVFLDSMCFPIFLPLFRKLQAFCLLFGLSREAFIEELSVSLRLSSLFFLIMVFLHRIQYTFALSSLLFSLTTITSNKYYDSSTDSR